MAPRVMVDPLPNMRVVQERMVLHETSVESKPLSNVEADYSTPPSPGLIDPRRIAYATVRGPWRLSIRRHLHAKTKRHVGEGREQFEIFNGKTRFMFNGRISTKHTMLRACEVLIGFVSSAIAHLSCSRPSVVESLRAHYYTTHRS